MEELNWILLAALFGVAVLYSCVGHGGASGYIAVLTLAGFGLQEIRPQVLILNILVSTVGLIQFSKAGYFRFRLTWPFIVAGIPLSYLGASLHLHATVLSYILGVVLLLSSLRLFWNPRPSGVENPPSILISLFTGAALGFLAGMTGTGGGIFLTPLLILAGWAGSKNAAATSALFILANSISGLTGHLMSQGGMDIPRVDWMVVAYLGGMLGAAMGSRIFSPRTVQITLAIVLLVASVKLLRV